ncbi:hypothetical protein [Cesiribacter sp. SM1]|uniref:hypothetical protein n=1 Tax=Cesiribacter sp. SM1 TaxID=2861196 RepID=UPI001CD24867|nr:hypothetical protein [Cesiribacter sp. SM1]
MKKQEKAGKTTSAGNGIGTRNERSLHAALKQWYALPGDRFEVPLMGFVIDLVRGGQLIEIQTRNFTAIRQKIKKLVEEHKVHLLHPITLEKWIVQVDATGSTVLSRRKSPRKGHLSDLFAELVRMPELIRHENLSLEFPLIQEEEVRCPDGQGSWRRKRVSVKDRRLLQVLSTHRFVTAADFLQFLPVSLPVPFSNKCLAAATALPLYRCRQITYCLRKMGLIVQVGKKANEILYEIKEQEQAACA